ncbi:MAG: glutamate racemase [Marinagarivorans sp.]|nr:glutamate racemase [Marinagarivorans sp.]
MHIVFFDSGLGGLSIAREVFNHAPTAQLIHQASYIADTAAYPYGNKEAGWLNQRIAQIMRDAIKQLQPDLIVIACNTASTLALNGLRENFNLPFVGVVPAIKPAATIAKGAIGILATPATVARDYTSQLIANYANSHRVLLYGAGALVQQAENKLLKRRVDHQVIHDELHALLNQEDGHLIDTIVLACTHFPLLKDELNLVTPRPIQWIDSGEAIARRIHQIAPTFGFSSQEAKPLKHVNFVTTGGVLSQQYRQAAPELVARYLCASEIKSCASEIKSCASEIKSCASEIKGCASEFNWLALDL